MFAFGLGRTKLFCESDLVNIQNHPSVPEYARDKSGVVKKIITFERGGKCHRHYAIAFRAVDLWNDSVEESVEIVVTVPDKLVQAI